MKQYVFKLSEHEEFLVSAERNSEDSAKAKAMAFVVDRAAFPDDLDPFSFVPTGTPGEFRISVGA
jgi:hypothetical protein